MPTMTLYVHNSVANYVKELAALVSKPVRVQWVTNTSDILKYSLYLLDLKCFILLVVCTGPV